MDKYINYNKWINGESPVLFIVGLAGSGKSTLAQELSEKYNCQYISTDSYDFDGNEDIDEMNKLPKEEFAEKFLYYVLDKLKHEDKRIVIEGIHLLYADFSILSNHPVIIKGEDYLEATQRAFERDKELGEEHLSVLAEENIELGKRIRELERKINK
jgi:dephospho-CoA kinase